MEIGCWKCKTSNYLLSHFPQLTLICVDPYRNYKHWDDHHDTGMYKDPVEFNALGESMFADLRRKYGKRAWCIRKDSLVAAPMVEDDSLDFAFIDGNYGYEYHKQDIEAWWSKVRLQGILFGAIIDSNKDSPECVKRAVEETIGTGYKIRERRWCYVKKEKSLPGQSKKNPKKENN